MLGFSQRMQSGELNFPGNQGDCAYSHDGRGGDYAGRASGEIGDRTKVLIEGLERPAAYPLCQPAAVEVHETHISWVFLAGDYAYKVKKPIRTSFLDYSTLQQRRHCCEEEIRLNRRYANDLYLGVVPITLDGQQPIVGEHRLHHHDSGEDDEPVEYAVKMHRFAENALLSEQLCQADFDERDVAQLAHAIGRFHQGATTQDLRRPPGSFKSLDRLSSTAMDNLCELKSVFRGEARRSIEELATWTIDYFAKHKGVFLTRAIKGFIRECHGDLHLANIVYYKGRLIPFDGIEFNDSLRWIDVISDAAFTAMDFAARGRPDLCWSFINAYLECTNDRGSLEVLRWYLVERALVRAKVAAMKAAQLGSGDDQFAAEMEDCRGHIELAQSFTKEDKPVLWITHGVSGSGKSTRAEQIVRRDGAIRLRSDVERKRYFSLNSGASDAPQMLGKLYCDITNRATYSQLGRVARQVLGAGYSVVVDATFLLAEERATFQRLAENMEVEYRILDCQADEPTLRQRIRDRTFRGNDPSDADESVLDRQFEFQEPLTKDELVYVVSR